MLASSFPPHGYFRNLNHGAHRVSWASHRGQPGFLFLLQTYKTGAMKRKAGEVAVAIGARILGDDQVEINGVASIANAIDGDLEFGLGFVAHGVGDG